VTVLTFGCFQHQDPGMSSLMCRNVVVPTGPILVIMSHLMHHPVSAEMQLACSWPAADLSLAVDVRDTVIVASLESRSVLRVANIQ